MPTARTSQTKGAVSFIVKRGAFAATKEGKRATSPELKAEEREVEVETQATGTVRFK